jgi:hypothetical protein
MGGSSSIFEEFFLLNPLEMKMSLVTHFMAYVDKSSNNIPSMSNLDMFEENCYLYKPLDSIHNQHIGYLAVFTFNTFNVIPFITTLMLELLFMYVG